MYPKDFRGTPAPRALMLVLLVSLSLYFVAVACTARTVSPEVLAEYESRCAGDDAAGPTVEEAMAAFRWSANNLSNHSLSVYMQAFASNDADDPRVYEGLMTRLNGLRRSINGEVADLQLSDDPDVAIAGSDFEAASNSVFELATELYAASPKQCTYNQLVREIAPVAVAVKAALPNNPDQIWGFVAGCAGQRYPGWSNQSAREDPYHTTMWRPATNPCPDLTRQLAQALLTSMSAFGSPAQGGGGVECPRGWCPHRGGCVPCDQ